MISTLSLFLAVFLLTSTRAGAVLDLGHSDTGAVLWYGNQLAPPFSITVDSTSLLYINALPLVVQDTTSRDRRNLPRPRQSLLSALRTRDSLLAAFQQLAERRGLSPDAALSFMVRELDARRDVVDTAYQSGSGILSTLRGSHTTDLYLPYPSRRPRPQREEAARQKASEIITLLNRGDMLVFGHGGTMSIIPRSRVSAFRLELDSLRAGTLKGRPHFSDPAMIDEIRHPIPYGGKPR